MTDLNNKTFCILPWVHFNTSTDGKILACCQSTGEVDLGNITQTTIENAWNSSQYQEFRNQILSGKMHPNCRKCYEKEAIGLRSFREISNEEYAHLLPLAQNNIPQIRYLELRFSNTCNLACKMCGPAFSTLWNKYSDKKYTLHLHTKDKNIVEACRPYLKEIETIHISGGEPILHADHYSLLEELISIGKTDLLLSYSTNLTVLNLKEKNILDYWKHFKKINLNVSIDGSGERGEYIRTGLDWKTLVQNIQTVQATLPHVNLYISFTLSIFNVFHAPECFLDLFKHNIITSTRQLIVQTLDKPDFYRIDLLNKNEVEKVKKRYQEAMTEAHALLSEENAHLFEKELNDIVVYLEKNNSSSHRTDFSRAVLKVDKLMGGDFLKTFPELASLHIGELLKISSSDSRNEKS